MKRSEMLVQIEWSLRHSRATDFKTMAEYILIDIEESGIKPPHTTVDGFDINEWEPENEKK